MIRIVKKPAERRQEIVFASRELFLAKDYESTTMQDIMQKLNIAKGTTYHYFKSKAEILDAVVQDIVDEYLEQVKMALRRCQGHALDKMEVLFAASILQGEKSKMLEALHRPGNTILHIQILAMSITKLAPLYASVIVQGCNEGVFQTEYPLECAEFFISAVQFLTDTGIYPWLQPDVRRRSAAFPKIIEQQLKAPPESFAFMIR